MRQEPPPRLTNGPVGPAPSCVLGGTGCAQPGNRVSPAEERADPHFQKGFPLPAPLGGGWSFQLEESQVGTCHAESFLTDVLSPGLCPIFTISLELDMREVP